AVATTVANPRVRLLAPRAITRATSAGIVEAAHRPKAHLSTMTMATAMAAASRHPIALSRAPLASAAERAPGLPSGATPSPAVSFRSVAKYSPAHPANEPASLPEPGLSRWQWSTHQTASPAWRSRAYGQPSPACPMAKKWAGHGFTPPGAPRRRV